MKAWLLALVALVSVHTGNNKVMACKLKDGSVVYVTQQECQNLKKGIYPTPTITPSATPTLVPTSTPSPTPTPNSLSITNVIVHNCSIGSSCYGWTTGVEVLGTGFATDSATKLRKVDIFGNEYFGTYQGGNGSTQIITDFYNLPLCTHYDVVVYGSTGTTSYQNTIQTVCN